METSIETNPTNQTPEVEILAAPAPQLEEPIAAIDPGDIVEAAEELLRENAPHDFEVLVIGGGPGGTVAAIRASQLGAKVGLIEERELGGVCLNRGCIPTKTLLESIDVMRLLRRAKEYGIDINAEATPNFKQMNVRKDEVVARLRQNAAHLLAEHQVEVLEGKAKFVGEHVVEITEADGATRHITAVHVIIATGSLPSKLPIEGADLPGVITSDELLQQDFVPASFVVIGAGAVGVEFAYLMHELGAKTLLLEAAAKVLPSEDDDIAHEMQRLLREYGMQVLTGAKLQRIEAADQQLRVIYEHEGREQSTLAAQVLFATGRRANTDGLDLEAAGVEHERGRVIVDEQCATNVGGVYAIGDCVRNVGWAHQAAGEGTLVAEVVTGHAVTVDLRHLPSCYYTHPEIASVGLTEQAAREQGLEARVGRFNFRSNGRAAAAGEHEGFVKIVVEAETEKLLGCQIIGPRATELINEAVLALKTNQTIEQMVGAIHAHPTFAEALPEAALAARKLQTKD